MAQTRNNAKAIEDHAFKPNEKLVLDANVWLLLHCPQGDPHDYRVTVYSAAFRRMLEAKSVIHIDATILGEFINRYARLVHGLLREKGSAPEDFKKFRKSALFKPVARNIAASARKILNDAHRVDTGFDTLDAHEVLTDYETGYHDFNDLIIAELCSAKGFALVTDDADFVKSKLNVLTTKDRL